MRQLVVMAAVVALSGCGGGGGGGGGGTPTTPVTPTVAITAAGNGLLVVHPSLDAAWCCKLYTPITIRETAGGRHMAQTIETEIEIDAPPEEVWAIFGDFEHARWMGERGRVKAAYGFSWDVVAGQIEGIYCELVE